MQSEAWNTEARLAQLHARRQRQARSRLVRRGALVAVGAVAFLVLVGAFAYGGASRQLATGVAIAGVDVGGLSPEQAVAVLERREASLAAKPLSVTADGRTYAVRAGALGVAVDWRGAVAEAEETVDGPRPLRGLRRFATRAFGSDVVATPAVDEAAFDRLLDRMARDDVVHRDAAIKLVGLRAVVVPERDGRVLDRAVARKRILAAFAGLSRAPVTVPTTNDAPRVSAADLEPALERVRTATSAPVTLKLGSTRYRLTRGAIGRLLVLPGAGRSDVRLGGPGADAYFASLSRQVSTPARNAQFIVANAGRVLVKPSAVARTLDVPRTAKKLFAATLSPDRRVAAVVVGTKQPERTTAEAKRMGITGVVSSYTTIYGGDANRIHNVRLVARLIDGELIAPGHTFSFNETTGERNASKGFLEAPVIINGELQTGLGGGVCQVSTTVFNAAYEGGLDIASRTNHALYISHYPQGRDATVNYPDTDLKFVNDTGRWLLLRTFVGASSLTVNLYGTPQNRRVETETAALEDVGDPPTTWRRDPTITRGRRVVVDAGSSPLATSVHRRVYGPSGKLLHDNTWYSSYRGEKKIVLVGTKPKPEPESKPAQPAEDAPAATDPAVEGPGT